MDFDNKRFDERDVQGQPNGICGSPINESTLAGDVVASLRQKNLTVATAESCTGGLLSKRLTDVPGASAVFELGLVTYANRIKTMLLRVPVEILAQYGAVSPQVARLMAQNVRELAASDYGVGVTGVAGPDGGSEEKPLGLVYICVTGPKETRLGKMRPAGPYPGREAIRQMAASHALKMLQRLLNHLPPGDGEQTAFVEKMCPTT